jgi:uncharacterized protein (DUF983 family)
MEILKKESSLYCITLLKCPKCHEGNLFCESNAWNFKKMLDMPDRCSVCGQDFQFEWGFYSGALWTSYPIVLILGMLLMALLYFGLEIPIGWTLLINGLFLILLQPMIMRWGRAFWINIFVNYDPEAKKNKQPK